MSHVFKTLPRLWRRLRSLQPLIRCYTRVDQVENAIPPTSTDLAIISRYSHRIWDLEITAPDAASLCSLQCTSMRPSFLLPNLVVLKWSPIPHIPIIFIQRLLSPSLISLDATLSEAGGVTLLSFLHNYPFLCQNLKSVEFRFAFRPQSMATVEAFSRAICRQDTLENVTLHAPIDEAALRYLATLPTRKVLSATLSERSRLQKESLLPTDSLFCSAEELEFVTSNLGLVTSLLRPREQIFHTFRLYYNGRPTSEALTAFLKVLTSQSRTTPLRHLTLSTGDLSRPFSVDQMAREAPRYRLSYDTLQPLMALGFLRVLFIEWSEQVSLDDDEVASLARSWPLLQVFHVYCGRGGYHPSATKHATLRGLLTLVNCCPELHTVSLPLDAREIPEIKDADARETNFACIIVPESPIDEALPVAEFLHQYLPSVIARNGRLANTWV